MPFCVQKRSLCGCSLWIGVQIAACYFLIRSFLLELFLVELGFFYDYVWGYVHSFLLAIFMSFSLLLQIGVIQHLRIFIKMWLISGTIYIFALAVFTILTSVHIVFDSSDAIEYTKLIMRLLDLPISIYLIFLVYSYYRKPRIALQQDLDEATNQRGRHGSLARGIMLYKESMS